MINWFPGHMNKTLKQMQADSKICSCFLYVLDARCPHSCLNPEFERVVGNKPIIYILNKADLITEKDKSKIVQQFKNENKIAVPLNATKSGNGKVIVNAIKQIMQPVLKQNEAKGVNFITRAMVLGVPNSGKSTIVNNLCKNARAVTGNKAGVTRSKQWVKVEGNIEILDTPGILLPNFDEEWKAYNLAFVGSVRDDVLNLTDISLKLIDKLNSIDRKILSTKYSVTYNNNTPLIDILTAIGKKRGCLIRGGEIDYERASRLLLGDFRSGKLGLMCLE